MPVPSRGPDPAPSPRAVIFDLDETLLDRRRAWQYTIEETIAMICGQRVNVGPLVNEYRGRPWYQALAILVDSVQERSRCEAMCGRVFERSALKRLLVHEGTGMGLDALRTARIEIGAISREPHALALKQIQSTGLDRFLAVLSATPSGEDWNPQARFADCLRFLEYDPALCAFVSGECRDIEAIRGCGARGFTAAWNATGTAAFPAISEPGDLRDALTAAWRHTS